jgi:hypothetical protein
MLSGSGAGAAADGVDSSYISSGSSMASLPPLRTGAEFASASTSPLPASSESGDSKGDMYVDELYADEEFEEEEVTEDEDM